MSQAKRSGGHELFEEIKSHGDQAADFIASFCDQPNPRSENDWLDFKVDPGHRDESGRKKLWFVALSGFANTGGGLLVWGIDAPDRVAESVRPVADPEGLKASLFAWRLDGTDPTVPNVEIESFHFADKSRGGFVVCLVPESTHKPHCTVIPKSRQYFVRLGDSFRVAPTSLLRALFYPQFQAIAKVTAWMHWSPHPNTPALCRGRAQAAFENVGTGSAKRPYLMVSTNGPVECRGNDIYVAHPDWAKRQIGSGLFELYTGRSIHPGQSLELFSREWDWPRRKFPDGTANGPPDCDDLWFKFQFFAEGQEPQLLIAKFTPSAQTSNMTVTAVGESIDSQASPT
jgi:hypothetical protein